MWIPFISKRARLSPPFEKAWRTPPHPDTHTHTHTHAGPNTRLNVRSENAKWPSGFPFLPVYVTTTISQWTPRAVSRPPDRPGDTRLKHKRWVHAPTPTWSGWGRTSYLGPGLLPRPRWCPSPLLSTSIRLMGCGYVDGGPCLLLIIHPQWMFT